MEDHFNPLNDDDSLTEFKRLSRIASNIAIVIFGLFILYFYDNYRLHTSYLENQERDRYLRQMESNLLKLSYFLKVPKDDWLNTYFDRSDEYNRGTYYYNDKIVDHYSKRVKEEILKGSDTLFQLSKVHYLQMPSVQWLVGDSVGYVDSSSAETVIHLFQYDKSVIQYLLKGKLDSITTTNDTLEFLSAYIDRYINEYPIGLLDEVVSLSATKNVDPALRLGQLGQEFYYYGNYAMSLKNYKKELSDLQAENNLSELQYDFYAPISGRDLSWACIYAIFLLFFLFWLYKRRAIEIQSNYPYFGFPDFHYMANENPLSINFFISLIPRITFYMIPISLVCGFQLLYLLVDDRELSDRISSLIFSDTPDFVGNPIRNLATLGDTFWLGCAMFFTVTVTQNEFIPKWIITAFTRGHKNFIRVIVILIAIYSLSFIIEFFESSVFTYWEMIASCSILISIGALRIFIALLGLYYSTKNKSLIGLIISLILTIHSLLFILYRIFFVATYLIQVLKRYLLNLFS
jgi:hypothetical protein